MIKIEHTTETNVSVDDFLQKTSFEHILATYGRLETTEYSAFTTDESTSLTGERHIPIYSTNMKSSIYIKHPIRSTFHVRYDSEFIRDNYKPETYLLGDCIDNQYLHFGPKSAFPCKKIVAALVFVGPHDRKFYMSPYKIVLRNQNGLNECANPFIIDLEVHGIPVDDYLKFSFAVAKQKNSMFENSQNGEIKLTEFFSGEQITINNNFVTQLPTKNKNSKQKQGRREIGTTKIKKYIDVHTIHLILCPYDENSTNEKIKWKPEILFCSNAFKPVTRNVSEKTFDYKSNKLIINDKTITPSSNDDQQNITILTTVPTMYACTNSQNQYIKIEITDKTSLYRFKDKERKVKLLLIPVKQFLEKQIHNDQCTIDFKVLCSLNLTLTKVTPDEHECIERSNQGLPISTSNESLAQAFEPPHTNIHSCSLKLVLCDKSEENITEYSRSIVEFDILNTQPESSEQSIELSSSDSDIDQLSEQTKQANKKDSRNRTSSPPLKSLKTIDTRLDDNLSDSQEIC